MAQALGVQEGDGVGNLPDDIGRRRLRIRAVIHELVEELAAFDELHDLHHTQCKRHSEKSAEMQWRVRALCEPWSMTR